MARKDAKWVEIGKLGLPAFALVVAAFALAYWFVGPAPPDHFTLAAGQPGGAYADYAVRYREALASYDIRVEILHTAGSIENLERLAAGEADVALVQGGVELPEEGEVSPSSLGSLFFEPLWVFVRPGARISRLTQLEGRQMSIGAPGSGTRAVAEQLLHDNGLRSDAPSVFELPTQEGVDALERGEIDALFLISGPSAPTVQQLLHSTRAVPMSFARADAYTRLHRYLSEVTLPQGVVDLSRNIPSRDVKLLAPTANLVVGPSFHPVLVDLLMHVAGQIHERGDLFEQTGEFPSPRFLAFPLSKEARRIYENGPPFLQRYLPFWAATQIDRLKVLLLPVVALLLPLARSFPPLYRWRVRSRIYRWYKELRDVDPDAEGEGRFKTPEERLAELARIESEVGKVPAPPSYAVELYDLRRHIEFVRERVGETRSPQRADLESPRTQSPEIE